MYIISKTFRFEAAHRLLGHPKCGRLHGHSYSVTFKLEATDLKNGMVRDYADLSPIKGFIDGWLDHRYLVSYELQVAGDPYWKVNEEEATCIEVERTTAENLALWLFEMWKDDYPELVSVTVCETANTTATFSAM